MSDAADARIQTLEALLDVGSTAMVAFDRNGRLTHRNFAEQQLRGDADDGDLIGMPVQDYLQETTWRTVDNEPIALERLPIMRALAGETVFSEYLIIERSSDDILYVLQNARPLMINGEMDGAAVITLDLTAIREGSQSNYTAQLEHAVRRSRVIADVVTEISDTTSALDIDRLSTFAIDRMAQDFRAASGALWLLDAEDRLHHKATYKTACDALDRNGYPLQEFEFAQEALERNVPIVVDFEDLRAPEAVVTCMGETQSVLVIPLRIRGERVGIAYLCLTSRLVLSDFDRLLASIWGRQCAQGIDVATLFQQVEEGNQRLVDVIDQLPQAVLMVDADTEQVNIVNRGAQQLFGLNFNEPTSVHHLPFLDIDGNPLRGKHHPLLRVLRSGERLTGDALLVPIIDGGFREVVAHQVPIRDGRNRITGGITVLQDRSDFAAMDRARYEFFSVVTHELRNPLTSLRGNLQLLERRVRRRGADKETADDLRRIDIAISEADRIGDLITRVLDVSRAGLGRLDILPESMDASDLVRNVAAAAQAREPERPVICECPDSVPVQWDVDRMYQVLSNLTQNADRYAPQTPIVITLENAEDDKVRITVRDHGPGVPTTIRHRLFRHYYRLDEGSSDSLAYMTDGSRGLGVGLYLSARLVQQHGGRLSVQDAEGGGSAFIISMPRVASPSVRSAANGGSE